MVGAVALVGYGLIGLLITRFDRVMMRIAVDENRAERAYSATLVDVLGNVLSVLALRRDPEANRIEVYTDTPWHIAQPYLEPLDLDLSDAEITRRAKARFETQDWAAARADAVDHRVSRDREAGQHGVDLWHCWRHTADSAGIDAPDRCHHRGRGGFAGRVADRRGMDVRVDRRGHCPRV